MTTTFKFCRCCKAPAPAKARWCRTCKTPQKYWDHPTSEQTAEWEAKKIRTTKTIQMLLGNED